jgi:hypothetical protein
MAYEKRKHEAIVPIVLRGFKRQDVVFRCPL